MYTMRIKRVKGVKEVEKRDKSIVRAVYNCLRPGATRRNTYYYYAYKMSAGVSMYVYTYVCTTDSG